jgi:hypothetical protein
MDPFSLSVGIAGLAGLAATTLKAAKSYMSSVKSAKVSVAAWITELEALESNLSSLDEFLRSVSGRELAFDRTSVLRSCASACEAKLKSLCKILGQVGDSRTNRLLCPLSEKEHQKTVQEIRAFAQWIQFALTVDGCSLLSRTSDDVLKILGGQLESFKLLQDLEDKRSRYGMTSGTKHESFRMISTLEHAKRFSTGSQDWIMTRNIMPCARHELAVQELGS